MGFDVTIHLVDPEVVAREFVPKLLGHSLEATPLDLAYPDEAGDWWKSARRALRDDPPANAAREVARLAVAFASGVWPYAAVRGFANLSLWREMPDEWRAKVPANLLGNPEIMFAALVAEFPALASQFTTAIEENDAPGAFVPAERVPELLAWVTATVEAFDVTGQRQFAPLVRVLRAAAENGLAVWEASDAPVPFSDEFPGDPELSMREMIADMGGELESDIAVAEAVESAGTRHFRFAHANPQPVFFDGDTLVMAWTRALADHEWLTVFDVREWPPRVVNEVAEPARCVASDGAGRFAFLFGKNFLRWTDDLSGFSDRQSAATRMTASIGFFDGRVVLFPPLDKPARPLIQTARDATTFAEIAELPALSNGDNLFHAAPVCGTIKLGDGSDMLIWGGNGYELGTAGGFTLTAAAKLDDLNGAVPAGKDGFCFVEGRRLYEFHRGKTRRKHHLRPTQINVLSVMPGPKHALLLSGWTDPKLAPNECVGLLYFPTKGREIPIPPGVFGPAALDETDFVSLIGFCPATESLLAKSRMALISVPLAAILDLPAYESKTGRRL